MKYGRMAVALTALIVAAGCTGSDVFQPVSPDGITPVSGARSGNWHTEKDCSHYFGLAGDTCTITKSNIKEIAVGSLVHYVQPTNAALTTNSDVVLDAGGTNKAFGRCIVDGPTGTGICVFNGGIGNFKSFRARVDVTPVGGVIGAWDGTYSFGQ